MPKKQKKIIIVEDDPFLSKVMNSTLKDEGFEIDTASDGKAGLEKIMAGNYNLVLLDLIMPVMNGFEVLEALNREKIKIPILVFSNLSQQDDKTEALRLGAKDYFVKSDMSIDEVVKTVKKNV